MPWNANDASRQAVQRMHEGVAKVRDNVQLAREAADSLSKIVGSSAHSYEMSTKISRSGRSVLTTANAAARSFVRTATTQRA